MCKINKNQSLMRLQKSLLEEQASLLASPVHPNVFPNMDIYALNKKFNLARYPNLRVFYRQRVKYLARLNSIQVTLHQISKLLRDEKNVDVYAESSISDANMMTGKVNTDEKTENVVDILGSDQTFKSIEVSSSIPTGSVEKLALQNFFKRPVQIAAGNINLSSQTLLELEVWNRYTLEATVRAKLRNYAFLRGNLHLRVTITGTPFNYGRLLGSYQPFPERNAALQYLLNAPASIPKLTQAMGNYLSQSRGAFMLDPKENKPVEFVCPFISTKPMHRLFNSSPSVIADTDPFEDLQEAGSLYLFTLNSMENVQSDTTPIRYFVYAWMENIELGAPTGTSVQITTESERICISAESDEREVGPWESMFSGAASISGALSQVPYIEPFASAAMMASSALAGIASIFGWSKPVIIDAPCYVKNVAFQNGAQTIGYDMNYRITLDPKQELTVDPRFAGSTQDEMVVNYISSVPSYFTTFVWAPSDVVDSQLFSCGVNPCMTSVVVGITDAIVQPTAMCFAAAPFDYWRGDIEYTFEVVASNFHRGKLKITYEPNVNQNVIISVDQLNKQYVKIWDIQETQVISLKVGWAYPREWAKTPDLRGPLSLPYSGVEDVPQDLSAIEWFNGMFVVSVFNPLTDFNDSSISVNVYARCPELFVNKLTTVNIPTSRNTLSSMVVVSAESQSTLSSQPVDVMYLNESTASTSSICEHHFGERPVSFRSLLKRYVTTSSQSGTNGAVGNNQMIWDLRIYPIVNAPFDAAPVLLFEPNLFEYLRYGYMGYRGGMRKRLRNMGTTNTAVRDLHAWTRVSLLPESNTDVNTLAFDTYASTGLINACANLYGTITMDQDSNGGVEVELPFYSVNLFHFAFATDSVGNNPGTNQNMFTTWTRNYRTIFPIVGAAAQPWVVMEDTCSGEDFTFFRFNAGPPFLVTLP